MLENQTDYFNPSEGEMSLSERSKRVLKKDLQNYRQNSEKKEGLLPTIGSLNKLLKGGRTHELPP